MIVAFIYGFTGVAAADTPIARFLAGLSSQNKEIVPHFFEWHWSAEQRIRDIYDGTGLFLIGHSFGGAKALEIAPSLVKVGIKPKQMVLLDPVPWARAWGLQFGGKFPWVRPARIYYPKFKVPDGVPAACWHRKDHFFDGEVIDGHEVEGADNELWNLYHSEFITDTSIFARINGLIQQRLAEIHARHPDAQPN